MHVRNANQFEVFARRTQRLAAGLLITSAILMAGCSAEMTSADPLCIEGRSIACDCSDGGIGAQTCQSDGTWGACTCLGDESEGPATTEGEAPAAEEPDISAGSPPVEDGTNEEPPEDAPSEPGTEPAQEPGGMPSDCELPDPPGDTIVNLADRGLVPGDVIDGYLEQYVADGVELHIPAGTYKWNGTFPPTLDNASIIGDGEVIFDAGDGWDFSGNFTASGDAEIRNITVKGKCNGDGKFRAIAQNANATLTLRNFWMPDGCYDELERSGFYIPSAHEGTLNMIDCRIERFPNNGLYASSATGPVNVIGGLYRNNNVANVRLGSSGSSAREVVIVNDDLAPPNERGQRNQRGVRIRAGGEDIVIEDVSITQTVSGQPIQIHDEADGSGTMNRVKIRNDEGSTAIGVNAGDWDGGTIHLTGTGDLNISGGNFLDVCRGAGCDAPLTAPREFCRE